jgi:hypothetical protein
MPANYHYTHISLGRMKALKMAQSRYWDLHQDIIKSGIIDPAILERMMVIRKLLHHASIGGVEESKDIPLLDELLGPNMGDIQQ